MFIACFALGSILLAAAPSPVEPPAGKRLKLTDGPLFIPDGLPPGADEVDLTLHLHGAPTVVEANFVRAKTPGVLANVTLPGLSAVYADRFRDPKVFQRILEETGAQLVALGLLKAPRVRRVTVTSFSAGFGGVREMLKDAAAFQRIDALVMADSIYAGFSGDPADRKVNPENMEGFLRFAREAAAGRKRFVLSHSQLHTPTYASTVETADYLISQLGGQREKAEEDWAGGLKLLSRFRQGQFEILAFAGDTGEDHMKHLRDLAVLLEHVRW